jgi:hypothetical protein
MIRRWKPCSRLIAADFQRWPLWGFDLSRKRRGAADETWVRPYRLAKAPLRSDLLFLSAQVRPQGGRPQPGAVTLKFVDSEPRLDGVVLLRPRYCALRVNGELVPPSERDYLHHILGAAPALFPLHYRARLRIGRREVVFSGTVAASW